MSGEWPDGDLSALGCRGRGRPAPSPGGERRQGALRRGRRLIPPLLRGSPALVSLSPSFRDAASGRQRICCGLPSSGGRAGGRGPFSACGGWVAPGRPPPDLASPRLGPLAAHPAPGACPASRAPAGPDGPLRPCRRAAGGGRGACSSGCRGMRRARGGGGAKRRQRGDRRVSWFFLLDSRRGKGRGAERDSNAGREDAGCRGARRRNGTC